MKDNLYTFKKDVWFVRLLNWAYDMDAVKTFPTFCPIFWLTVITIFTLPLILIIKMFGKAGTTLLKNLESYKRDKFKRNTESFIKRCSKENLTDEEAYDIVSSKCWGSYKYDLEYSVKDSILEKYWKHVEYLQDIRREKERVVQQKKQKVVEFKESKWFIYIAYLVTILTGSLVLYTFYKLYISYEFLPVDWERLEILGKAFTGVFCGGGILYLAIVYIFKPLIEYLKCTECKLCKLGWGKYVARPFVFVGKGFLIICDMIYMSYKQACPMITWKDEK